MKTLIEQRKIGKFMIPRQLYREQDTLVLSLLFKDFYPISITYNEFDKMIFCGYSPNFNPVEEGQEIYKYHVDVSISDNSEHSIKFTLVDEQAPRK